MTGEQLALGYLRKCRDRMAALDVLRNRQAHSDVVRESQELVELAVKGLLRSIGVDPPRLHDVGPLLRTYAGRLPLLGAGEIDALIAASDELRREREFSLYGDVDFIPTEEHGPAESERAWRQASLALAALERVLSGRGGGAAP